MISLTLPYPPSKNRLHRRVGNLTLLSREAREYQRGIAVALLAQLVELGREPLTGPVALTLRFYRPRKAGDVDGRLPWLIDCLQGYAYRDDKQVVEIHAYRLEDKVNPRVEVVVTEVAA